MPRLNLSDIDERLQLYLDYRDAVTALDEASARFPEQMPPDFTVASPSMVYDDLNALHALLQGTWAGLRTAVLGAAERRVADVEAKVVAFEAGQEV